MEIIVTEELTKTYRLGKNNLIEALRGVSLTIESGEFVAVMGPSGSGKSTLLRIIGCLDEPTGGRFYFKRLDAANMKPAQLTRVRAHNVGFVFQTPNLIPTLTALENVIMVAEYAGITGRKKVEQAIDILASVGLSGRLNHRPSELSTGEQQRVAIARALVKEPEIVLADEPTGSLDSVTAEEIMDLLRDVRESENRAIVVVTHDPRMAAYADRIVFLKDGRVVDEETNGSRRGQSDVEIVKDDNFH
ncbi:MAG: ABC transporter ATP-binding protein [Candidatus Aquicultorales bacterium]